MIFSRINCALKIRFLKAKSSPVASLRVSAGLVYLGGGAQYGSVKGYAVLKTINTGVFIMMPVPLCLTCLDRNFETGFFTTLGLFLAHSFRYVLSENLQSQPTQKKGSSCGCNP